MTENKIKIEKIARNATNLLKWLNKNLKVITKNYKYEDICFTLPIKLTLWLENNCLSYEITKSKHIVIYPTFCKRLAVRGKLL